MEEGVLGQEIELLFEPSALTAENFSQLFEGVKATIGERSIGKRPEALSGLEFRRIGWKRHDFETRRPSHLGRTMKPRTIFHQHNVMVGSSFNTATEGSDDGLIGGLGDLRNEPEATLAGFRPDEGIDVQPLVTRLDRCSEGLPPGCPERTADGLEAHPMLVHCPQ